ncbi:MAG: substrate-binding domain-containing protein [Clostridiales bacterium]|nr:substrate-binding domain-containing protein [Clostridiales bacterium]
MRKKFALFLAVAMTISTVTGFTTASAAEEETSADGGTYSIIYLTPSTASDFWSQVETGIQQAMKDYEEELGITIEYQSMGPAEESDAEGYVEAFENAIAAAPDAIVTATLNIDPTVPKAKEATEAGIVLNFVNCGLGLGGEGTYAEYYNEFYYCSNTTIGELAAEAFLDAMDAAGMSTDSGVIGMQMNMENAALDYRMQGFADYMAENAPDLTLTDIQYNGNDSADAQTDAEATISAYGDELIGIYSGNNVTCDGVIAALRAAGMSEGFVSVGVDSDDVEITALSEGYLSAIIVQDAFTQGYYCMENAILTVVNGENPESEQEVNVPPVIVTNDNINDDDIVFMMSPYVQ